MFGFYLAFHHRFSECAFLKKTHTLGDTVILQCNCNCVPTHKRWRKDRDNLSSSNDLTHDARWRNRLRRVNMNTPGLYDLQLEDIQHICEITTADDSYERNIVVFIIGN